MDAKTWGLGGDYEWQVCRRQGHFGRNHSVAQVTKDDLLRTPAPAHQSVPVLAISGPARGEPLCTQALTGRAHDGLV